MWRSFLSRLSFCLLSQRMVDHRWKQNLEASSEGYSLPWWMGLISGTYRIGRRWASLFPTHTTPTRHMSGGTIVVIITTWQQSSGYCRFSPWNPSPRMFSALLPTGPPQTPRNKNKNHTTVWDNPGHMIGDQQRVSHFLIFYLWFLWLFVLSWFFMLLVFIHLCDLLENNHKITSTWLEDSSGHKGKKKKHVAEMVVMPAWAILICPLCVGSTSSFHGCILGPTSRAGPSYHPFQLPWADLNITEYGSSRWE